MKGRERWAGKKAYYNLIHNDFPFFYENNTRPLSREDDRIYNKILMDEFNDEE